MGERSYRRKSQRTYRPPVHHTSGARFNRSQARNRRQSATRQSVYGRNRTFRNGGNRNGNRNGVKSIFSGGFFEKFASELKNLTK